MAAQDKDKAVDPRVATAIHHWAPRFVANGVALTDFEEVTASITSWDDWCGAWSARAAVHEEMGREALANKNSSAPASICSAPASTTISASSCSCRTSRR